MIKIYFKKLKNNNLEITEKMLNDILSYMKRQDEDVVVSKELFDRTYKEKCEFQDKYWKAYDELVEQDREIKRLNNIINGIENFLKTLMFESNNLNHRLTSQIILMRLNELKGADKE